MGIIEDQFKFKLGDFVIHKSNKSAYSKPMLVVGVGKVRGFNGTANIVFTSGPNFQEPSIPVRTYYDEFELRLADD